MYTVPYLHVVCLNATSHKPTWEGTLLSVGFSHTCMYTTPLPGVITILTCVHHAFSHTHALTHPLHKSWHTWILWHFLCSRSIFQKSYAKRIFGK